MIKLNQESLMPSTNRKCKFFLIESSKYTSLNSLITVKMTQFTKYNKFIKYGFKKWCA